MPYKVSQLLDGIGAPVSATVDEPVRDALDRMLRHDFNQLPVVKGTGQQRQFYFITYESILVALHNFGGGIENSSLRVDDALRRVPRVYRADDDLFELLVGMRETGAALIVSDDRSITHVVTSYDTTRYFRQWAEDIMQVRDIEHSLRRIINAAFKKPDGEIDEQSRESAVEEMTSSNRALRKKFGRAVGQYIAQQAGKAVVLSPKWSGLAFVELLRTPTAGAVADTPAAGGENSGISAAPSDGAEPEVSRLLTASEVLRKRFEAGLSSYLANQVADAVPDEASLEDAFKLIYDRAERAKEFGRLTLADYIQLFFRDVCWGRCKDVIRLKEEEVRHMLDGVRDTRNILAHFREEEVTAQKRQQLKVCADWLSERERIVVAAFERTPLMSSGQ